MSFTARSPRDGNLLGDAVRPTAAVGDHGAVDRHDLPARIVLADDSQRLVVVDVAGHRHDDQPVGDVEVEVRHLDHAPVALGAGQRLHDDHLEARRPQAALALRCRGGVRIAGIVAPLQQRHARPGDGDHVVDVAVGVGVVGEAVGQPHHALDPQPPSQQRFHAGLGAW
jgi:hypothetical protein